MLLPVLTLTVSLTLLASLQTSWTTCTMLALPAMADTTESAPGCGGSLISCKLPHRTSFLLGRSCGRLKAVQTKQHQLCNPVLDTEVPIQQVHMMLPWWGLVLLVLGCLSSDKRATTEGLHPLCQELGDCRVVGNGNTG